MRSALPSAPVDTNPKETSDANAPPTLVPSDDADGFSDYHIISPNAHTSPASEFHDFDEDRSPEKFKAGQVWAVYNNVGPFPRHYGWISRVEPEPFTVHLLWLKPCSPQEQKDISISCGTFRVLNKGGKFHNTVRSSPTSPCMDAGETRVPRQLKIRPQVGEVWAVSNWNPSRIVACEFAVVEVIGRSEAGTRHSVLEKVDGYIAVFKPDNEGNGVLEIPAGESSRSFSHHIPYFHLMTGEEGGELRGFYELDAAAVPYPPVLSILCGQGKHLQGEQP